MAESERTRPKRWKPTLDPSKWKLSRHAAARILEMRLSPAEVAIVANRPEYRYWSNRQQSFIFARGNVALAVSDEKPDGSRVIITALWATAEAWEADYQAGETSKGRAPRAEMGNLRPGGDA